MMMHCVKIPLLSFLGILLSLQMVPTSAGLTTIIDNNDVKAELDGNFTVACQFRAITSEDVKEASSPTGLGKTKEGQLNEPLSESKPLITHMPAGYVVQGGSITTASGT